MKKIVYFKICDDIEEYKKIEKIQMTMFKRKELNIINKILEILNNLKFYIFFKCNFMKEIKKDNDKVYIIFINDIKEIEKNNRINKIMDKIEKKIDKLYMEDKNVNIILSKKIKEIANNKIIKNKNNINRFSNMKKIILLSEKNKNIYNEHINKIIKNVILMEGKKVEEQTIYILLKSNNIQYKKWVNDLINNYKMINIVTQNIKQFEKYEEEVEENLDAISILNNKRKSLAKAKYIINVDFINEEILNYSINRNAIIFNISNNEIRQILGFEGIIINNIKIEDNKEFDTEDEYRANKIEKQKILNKINNNQYYLEGNNGKIDFLELMKKNKYVDIGLK